MAAGETEASLNMDGQIRQAGGPRGGCAPEERTVGGQEPSQICFLVLNLAGNRHQQSGFSCRGTDVNSMVFQLKPLPVFREIRAWPDDDLVCASRFQIDLVDWRGSE